MRQRHVIQPLLGLAAAALVVGFTATAEAAFGYRKTITIDGTRVVGGPHLDFPVLVSVVDPNLRAHDVPNLYLVGSGCFVTASSSPPTLTIAALAIRASEHIVARLLGGVPARSDALPVPDRAR